MVRLALTAALLVAVFGCAPKGGNLGRRVNAPTPDTFASPATHLPADLASAAR